MCLTKPTSRRAAFSRSSLASGTRQQNNSVPNDNASMSVNESSAELTTKDEASTSSSSQFPALRLSYVPSYVAGDSNSLRKVASAAGRRQSLEIAGEKDGLQKNDETKGTSTYTHIKSSSRPKKKALRPGTTSKNNRRHFVQHNYHDHALDPVDESGLESDGYLLQDSSSHGSHYSDDKSDTKKSSSCGVCSDKRKARRGPRGGVAMPFPLKLHEMLEKIEEDGRADIISWQPHGRCFLVHKPAEFVRVLMPTYFRQTKITSFQRQLNLYGFSRLTSGRDKGGYYHELFLRGKPYLTQRMTRIRIKGTGIKAAASPATEPDFYSMLPMNHQGMPEFPKGPVATSMDTSEEIHGMPEFPRVPDVAPMDKKPTQISPKPLSPPPTPLGVFSAPEKVSSMSSSADNKCAKDTTPFASSSVSAPVIIPRIKQKKKPTIITPKSAKIPLFSGLSSSPSPVCTTKAALSLPKLEAARFQPPQAPISQEQAKPAKITPIVPRKRGYPCSSATFPSLPLQTPRLAFANPEEMNTLGNEWLQRPEEPHSMSSLSTLKLEKVRQLEKPQITPFSAMYTNPSAPHDTFKQRMEKPFKHWEHTKAKTDNVPIKNDDEVIFEGKRFHYLDSFAMSPTRNVASINIDDYSSVPSSPAQVLSSKEKSSVEAQVPNDDARSYSAFSSDIADIRQTKKDIRRTCAHIDHEEVPLTSSSLHTCSSEGVFDKEEGIGDFTTSSISSTSSSLYDIVGYPDRSTTKAGHERNNSDLPQGFFDDISESLGVGNGEDQNEDIMFSFFDRTFEAEDDSDFGYLLEAMIR